MDTRLLYHVEYPQCAIWKFSLKNTLVDVRYADSQYKIVIREKTPDKAQIASAIFVLVANEWVADSVNIQIDQRMGEVTAILYDIAEQHMGLTLR